MDCNNCFICLASSVDAMMIQYGVMCYLILLYDVLL